jgi:nitrile hydratase accessory protein
MTISNPLDSLPKLPRDDGDPAFAEPWQAQAFALAVKLSEQGHFTWKEWAAALAAELKGAEERGEPDDGSQYYRHWLTALERLVTAKGLMRWLRRKKPGRRHTVTPRTGSPLFWDKDWMAWIVDGQPEVANRSAVKSYARRPCLLAFLHLHNRSKPAHTGSEIGRVSFSAKSPDSSNRSDQCRIAG